MASTEMFDTWGFTKRISVDPLSVRAAGGSSCPRLIVPIVVEPFDEHPRDPDVQRISYVLLAHCRLLSGQAETTISDGIGAFDMVSQLNGIPDRADIEFPLDAPRIEELENGRQAGDLRLAVSIRALCQIIEHHKVGNRNESDRLLKTVPGQIAFAIPESHWVRQILPRIDFGRFVVIQIPKGQGPLKEAWDTVSKAEKAFSIWDVVGVFANCRGVGQLLDGKVKERFADRNMVQWELWDRASHHFNHFASLPLHLEEIKAKNKLSPQESQVLRRDAEYVLFLTKALIRYAESLLEGR
jgi:hypothetical protein